MSFPPSASLEGPSFPDGLKSFSSGASNMPVPGVLLTITISTIVFGLFDVKLASIIAHYFCMTIYHLLATIYYRTPDTQSTYPKPQEKNTCRLRPATKLSHTPLQAVESPLSAKTRMGQWLHSLTSPRKPGVIVMIEPQDSELALILIHDLPSDVTEDKLCHFLETVLAQNFSGTITTATHIVSLHAAVLIRGLSSDVCASKLGCILQSALAKEFNGTTAIRNPVVAPNATVPADPLGSLTTQPDLSPTYQTLVC